MLKILHTADWHIGRRLYGQRRYEAFEAFLNWMIQTLKQQEIDVLLISGDIFDTTTPGSTAQNLYYKFLGELPQTPVRHTIVTGGNHDSPSLLNASASLLKQLNIHVVGRMTDDPADEVIVLKDQIGTVELIVLAVPYLRDQDIRESTAGETIEDKARKRVQGIADHYALLTDLALEKRNALSHASSIPIIAMGHLFAAGGSVIEGDGVRDLSVGSLAHLPVSIFSQELDYVALGHIHVPQVLNDNRFIRYSGSPIAMGFGEARQQKSLVMLSIEPKQTEPRIKTIDVPCFQKLRALNGDLSELQKASDDLIDEGEPVWVEITHTGKEGVPALRAFIDALNAQKLIQVLRCSSEAMKEKAQQADDMTEQLSDLSVDEVFDRVLKQREIPTEKHTALQARYREIIQTMQETDTLAQEAGEDAN